MSAATISSFYDMDLFFTGKSLNMNPLHLGSVLDKRAVGTPLSNSHSCSLAPSFFRSHSVNTVDSAMVNSKSRVAPFSSDSSMGSLDFGSGLADASERLLQLQELLQQKNMSQANSTRYKTELCRPFEESGSCKYGEKCQFAHGYHELRNLSRHPKYKTEPCRTFHTIGYCPYGPRCHFIHNADERRLPSGNGTSRPALHHSVSFAGFPSLGGFDSNPTSRTPPPPTSSSSSGFFEDLLSPSSTSSGAFPFQGQDPKSLLAPLLINICGPPSPPYSMTHQQSLRRLSPTPRFDCPPSPPESLSDRDSWASGSPSSSASVSGADSPTMDLGRRLPIFSRLSISDD
uniref:mRNA decay activator protein ZFP36 n=1 Tax=Scleropages formosus TaxID=113540 RepID=A0A8C9RJX0_SCLFO